MTSLLLSTYKEFSMSITENQEGARDVNIIRDTMVKYEFEQGLQNYSQKIFIRIFLVVNFYRRWYINHNFGSGLDSDQSYDTESSCYVSANRIRTYKKNSKR